jgi:hypothetical protein
MAGQSSSQAAAPFQWWKPALFFLVVIVGLWFVKWQPYYGKALPPPRRTVSVNLSSLTRREPFSRGLGLRAGLFPGGMESGGIRRAAGIAHSGADPA